MYSRLALLCLLASCGESAPAGADASSDASSDAPSDALANDPCGAPIGLRGPMSALDLSVPGRPFELDLASADIGERATPGNGCVVQAAAGIGFGGTAGVRVIPPDVSIGGDDGDSQYCGLASGAPVSRGGVEVGQLNVRYALFIGRGYVAATTPNGGPKAIIPFVVNARGDEGLSSRPMVFWGGRVEHDGATYGAIGVTEGTVQSYQEPEDDYFPAGPGRDAIYFGPAPDHRGAATRGTPVIGDEWVIIEHEWDLRRDRGNPNGLNRLWVWTRDGAVAGPILDIPLTWDGGHEFAGDRFAQMDGLGYYWNNPAVRTPDDHVIYSHLAFAANRPTDLPIGPPPGFLTSCPQ
jgi:hypothetical protein